MAAIILHGFVQVWTKNGGMSKSEEACIEIIEEKEKSKLSLSFSAGKCNTFQLNNNIESIVLRSYEEKRHQLYLTFRNKEFLFIERLSFTDAKDLKMFLDRIHQNKLQSPGSPEKDEGVFTSTTTQEEINKTSFHDVLNKSNSTSFETAKGNGIPVLQKTPLLTPKSTTLTCKGLLENQYWKTKRMLSSDSEITKNFPEESSISIKKPKMNNLSYIGHNQKIPLNLKELKEIKKLEFMSLLMAGSNGNPYFLKRLTEKILLAFLLEAKYGEYYPEWDEFDMFFYFVPDKLWQGFPNLGNTCYMNAVLQSLFSIPSFADDLLNQGFPWGKIRLDALSMCLAQLFLLKDFYNIKIKEKLLVNIKKSISAVSDIFCGDVQNDAHEFLGLCLDQIKENMGRLNTIWKTQSELEKENSPQQVFAGNAATDVCICPVVTNFELELLRSIICRACGQVVLKTEMSNYLSINLPQGMKEFPLSIQSTFDLFFGAEELEYKCEKCKHRSSVAVHKFSRLPRVLIVHLKRYSFNEFWSLRKDDQAVIISKYLKLSSHCNGNTKPPFPLSKKARSRDFQICKIFQNLNSETNSSSIPSTKLTSKSKDSSALHIGTDKEPVSQHSQRFFKGVSREQQKGQGKDSRLNIIKPELLCSGDGRFIRKELFVGPILRLEDTYLSAIREAYSKPTSSPDARFTKVHVREMAENPKLKTYNKTNLFLGLDFESVTKTIKGFYKDKPRIQKEFQNVAEETRQYEGMRIYKEALQQALLQSFPKPVAQGHTKNIRKLTKFHFHEADISILDSRRNPGTKHSLGKKTESVAKEQKRDADKGDPTYRLIGVVSHLGNTPNSGHYVSDAYDFERQLWFSYNDLQVSNIQEAGMQQARLCTGYIFFYMHNEIFEELSRRDENSQLHSTEAGKKPQKE
ncbi:ubiquitin carboxyl-terminal hydrolase 26 [Tupaia chinensis]|uniref:Ubiquitin carboxyl-terminal hydrolase n=1 Tax=Tupaia chinensis TaxID=246437 RepID=L8Y4Z9_TUPCH|nr:ubiquitin carboxyl-terminal hydrolase 26 [Tupaia chinensis]ELV09456.1 Ubiquitin carboxyl-terminal hydrolase 26 [Tupaia chinensis]